MMSRLYSPRPLEIIDTSLREGQQTSLLHDYQKYFFDIADKLDIVRALILYGIKYIELFSPVVSSQEAQDFERIRSLRDELITQKGYTFLLAHVRAHPRDIEAAVEAGFDGLNIYLGTSPQSRHGNHGKDLATIAQQAGGLLEEVRRKYPELILRFSGEDAFRTDLDDLFQVYDPLVPLVDRLGFPDTVGVATPDQVSYRVEQFRQRYPETPLEIHFHDDRGFALWNTLAAIKAGARYVNTTLLGFGERSGIPSMTALLFNLFLDGYYDQLEGYHLRGSYPINVLMADKLKTLVPSKEPVSLTNRTHTAGVHQGAVLRDAATYEALPMDLFGVSERDILLGPLSGWNMVHYFLKEIHYFQIDEPTARQIAAGFKEQIYASPGEKPADVLLEIAEEQFNLKRTIQIPDEAPHIVQRMDTRETTVPVENTISLNI
jgi:homocitrate synthase